MGGRVRRHGDCGVTEAETMPMSADRLEGALRQIGGERYHNLHRFHRRLHGGGCSLDEVRAWALNRYVYQSAIPRKDATILSRMTESTLRREWLSRIVDHDGPREGEGGIAKWLKLTASLGFPQGYVISTAGILPATRFAVDAYVNFCAQRPLLEAVASSLTELFSPQIIGERISGMLAHYDFVSADTLSYFTARPPQAQRDSDFALDYVKRHAVTAEQQQAVLTALRFSAMCSGRSSMRCGAPTWTGLYRPAPGSPGPSLLCRTRSRMSDRAAATPLDLGGKPRLPRGVRLKHDEQRGEWVLLAPERLLKLNAISVEILKRCTGEATLDTIVDDLSTAYAAPRERIEADVLAMLGDLVRKRLVDL